MEIVIASTIVPFIEGGGSFIVDWLEEALVSRGHSVFTLRIPFYSDYRLMADQMLGLRLLDIRDYGERLITIRPPSYLLRHPNKIIWFIHHHRTAYDLWDSPYREFPDNEEGLAYRNLIFNADMTAFREARKIFTNSGVVAKRLKYFNGVEGEILYPPLMKPQRYTCRSYSDYVLYLSRLVHHKRQHLAIESMRYVNSGVKLVLAGRCEDSIYRDELCDLIAKYKLQEKVVLIDGWLSEDRKLELFADCLAAIYIPLDEDSYGYPSLEAYATEKPVITTVDAGGTLELIENGVNGLITEPEPARIAEAMDTLFLNRERAREMGLAGKQRIHDLGIGWDRLVERLLQ